MPRLCQAKAAKAAKAEEPYRERVFEAYPFANVSPRWRPQEAPRCGAMAS